MILDKDSRIAIVGGGPSGVISAMHLKKGGYNNVVVFENSDYVGGHARTTALGNDMAVTFFFASYPFPNTDFFENLGFTMHSLPKEIYYSLKTSKVMKFDEKHNFFAGTYRLLRYAYYHRSLKGSREPTIGKVSPALCEDWHDFARDYNFGNFAYEVKEGDTEMDVPFAQARFCALRRLTGYTTEEGVTALYNARYLQPSAIFAMMRKPDVIAYYCEGGTQQAFEKIVKDHAIDVRLGSQITSITRGKKVKVALGKEAKELEFDYLVRACNPNDLEKVLDTTDEERSLYSQLKTIHYRTYEVTFEDITLAQPSVYIIFENMALHVKDRPVSFVKLVEGSNTVVIRVNAQEKTSDATIIKTSKNSITAL